MLVGTHTTGIFQGGRDYTHIYSTVRYSFSCMRVLIPVQVSTV
jgi:hypothetical protein